MNRISVYIIAYNEEDKIKDAINSVLWADEIVVADSFSQDKTAAIAHSMGARVVQIEFNGFGDLRNNALKSCSHQWIFSLDSDERCTPEVRDEILSIIEADNDKDVYFVPRKNFFMGKWIKHSGFYPNYRQPQLFRKHAMAYKPEPVHEGYILKTHQPVGYLKHAIWQFPFKNLAEIIHKAGKYSTLGAVKLREEGKRSGMTKAVFRGLWAFIQHYFLKRGVLDGWPGFVIAFGNFEGTFYKYAKLHESGAGWSPPPSPPLKKCEKPDT